MARYAFTIVVGSLLVFLVQPMAGKRLMPWFGGGAAVWATCLMFFQAALLLGYLYAHGVSRIRSPRWQAGMHLAVLAASLFLLPLEVAPSNEAASFTASPVWNVVLALAAGIGVPFVLLSAASPLLQAWFSRESPGRSPYRLYALSNAGSLAALVAYPVVVEPWLGLSQQFGALSWGYVLFVAMCGWCAVRGSFLGAATIEMREQPDRSITQQRVPLSTWCYWLALPACGTTMLIACTNQLTQEVASSPFLWVLPLGLYLLTFMICFDHPRWHRRRVSAALLVIVTLAACGALYAGPRVPFPLQVVIYGATLFTTCMALHGELVRMRPGAERLTSFYLAIAAGGALGGGFAAAAAPALFDGYWEFHIGLVGTCILALSAARHNGAWDWPTHRLLARASLIGIVALVFVLAQEATHFRALAVRRNFYGMLRVIDERDAAGPARIMAHGRVRHGMQFLAPAKRRTPTLVFGERSAIGLAMRHHPRRNANEDDSGLRVGVVGLGVGTIAAHGQDGDTIRFYEINPAVEDLCREYFTFLSDSPAEVSVALGDGRVVLAREEPQQYDILAIDAFSGDAIPTHLLTEECGQVYLRQLRSGGLLLFHISNDFVDLVPVVRGLAQRLGWRAWRVESPADARDGVIRAVWMVLAERDEDVPPQLRDAADAPSSESSPTMLWTDDYAPVWRVLK